MRKASHQCNSSDLVSVGMVLTVSMWNGHQPQPRPRVHTIDASAAQCGVQGIPPMRVGGKRRLSIPAELAYGDEGFGRGVIPPGAGLDFNIELLGPPGRFEQLWEDLMRLLTELRTGV